MAEIGIPKIFETSDTHGRLEIYQYPPDIEPLVQVSVEVLLRAEPTHGWINLTRAQLIELHQKIGEVLE